MKSPSGTPKVRLVQVIWDLSVMGGAEKALVMMAKGLRQLPYEVTVVSVGGKGELGREIEESGVPVIALNVYPLRALNPLAILKLYSCFRALKPVIVHSHINYSALMAARLAQVPVLVRHEHNIYPQRSLVKIVADRLTDIWVDKIIAVADAVKEATVAREFINPEKIKVIPWGINAKELLKHRPLKNVRQDLGILPKDLVLITVASLTEKKGHDYLVKAIPGVLEKYPQTKLVLVGDGPQRARLNSLVGQLGLEGRVIFTGVRRDIPDLLSIADLFILPSLYEGLPIALMEAQTLGLPCIATRVGGAGEVVKHRETGILVQPKSVTDLTDAICELLSQPERRSMMSEAARNRARSQFSLERFFTELHLLYQDMVKTTNLMIKFSCYKAYN